MLHALTGNAGGRLLLLVVLLAVTSVLWLAIRRRDGRFRLARLASDAVLTGEDLGRPLGRRATFVQFSTPTCASCPQVSRTLSTIADHETGVVHVEVPAHRRPDLVRSFGVLRTPTVLLLGPEGAVRSRTSGPLARRQAIAALAEHAGSSHAAA